MLTATVTSVLPSRQDFPEPIQQPPRLPSMLHDLLWYIEFEIQRWDLAPSLGRVCRAFHVSPRTAAEMIRLLGDEDLVYLTEGDHPYVLDLTIAGREYCYSHAPV